MAADDLGKAQTLREIEPSKTIRLSDQKKKMTMGRRTSLAGAV